MATAAFGAGTLHVTQSEANHVGARYEGQLSVVTGLREGRGTYYYRNDYFRYEGEWLEGLKHGSGRLGLADGGFYDGAFVHGEMTGEGTRNWADGSTYTGDFLEGLRHGMGIFEKPDGTQYNGSWKNGQYSGAGEFLLPRGSGSYIGEFQEHRFHGRGELDLAPAAALPSAAPAGEAAVPSPEISRERRKSSRERGKRGAARVVARRYVGEFARGVFEGDGELLEDGDAFAYSGLFRGGLRHGRGLGRDRAGVVYDGDWIEDGPRQTPARWDLGVPGSEESYLPAAERLREEAQNQLSAAAADPKKDKGKKPDKKGAVEAEPPPGPELELVAGEALPEVALRVVDKSGARVDAESGRRFRVTLYREKKKAAEGGAEDEEIMQCLLNLGDHRPATWVDPDDPDAAAAAAAAAVPGGPASAASRTSPGREERRASPRGRGASASPPRSGSPAAAAAVASPPAAASAASRQAASSSRGGSSPPGPGGSLRPSGSSPPALSPRTAARTSRNTATAAAAPAASSSSSAPSRRSAEGNRGVAAVTAAVVPALPLWTPRRDEAARLLGTRNEGSPDRLGALSLDEVLSQVEGFDHAMRQKAAYARRVTGRLAGQRKAAEARNRVLQAGCSKRIASPSSPRLSGHGAISAKVRGRGSANGLAVASAPGDPAHESDRHNALQVPAIALETLPLALASSDADKAPRVEALTSAVAKTIADVRRLVQERSKTAIAAADAAAKRTSDVEVSIEEAIVPGPDQAEEEARSATDRGPLWLGLAGDDDDELSESDEEEGTFATASPAGSASAVRLEPSFRRAA
eukprot:TRINITY_DN12713_c0_g4_i3.p1 TRINITY_DN12713_c0_g4~~TRINITY_DN12713_c0_g4_i3.p1  ORF type:complete len:808 (+),score=195.95 TRINITY_DN12713_c0_g4_i3:77-2500(+)